MDWLKRVVRSVLYRIKFQGRLKTGKNVRISMNAAFEGNNSIGYGSSFSGVMGYGSYVGENAQIHGKVGRFCCIASGVHVVNGFHPTKQIVSMYPAFYTAHHPTTGSFVKDTIYDEYRYAEPSKKYDVVIGNDVWIGHGAILMAGITVGDGAVIAAGAIVTKDVKPYDIVAGVPAKKINQRFTDEQIQKILEDPWWNRSLTWIRENAHAFSDIDTFWKESAYEEN